MRCEWKTYAFGELLQEPVRNGLTKPKSIRGKGVKMIAMGEIFAYSRIANVVTDRVPVTEKELQNCNVKPLDILFARQSLTLEGAGKCSIVTDVSEDTVFESHLIRTRIDQRKADPFFIYYYFNSPHGKENIKSIVEQVAAAGIRGSDLIKLSVPCPCLEEQKKISTVLCSIDDKIELNNKINENLIKLVFSLYRRMFVQTANDQRIVCRTDEYFNISIGKTPPRKEPEWFSHKPTDRIWISIADMGNCSVYISDSSEYLTHKAVERFNVKLIPSNTVVLSFKLTVGRVAITDGIMTTNEAIAHFKTETPEINEYLYCYLKEFNYQTMGSTSSIATAVNSKIIKAMPFIIPTETELNDFHNLVAPCFTKIKLNQRENVRLTALRDILLSRLMSGEINISDIDL